MSFVDTHMITYSYQLSNMKKVVSQKKVIKWIFTQMVFRRYSYKKQIFEKYLYRLPTIKVTMTFKKVIKWVFGQSSTQIGLQY